MFSTFMFGLFCATKHHARLQSAMSLLYHATQVVPSAAVATLSFTFCCVFFHLPVWSALYYKMVQIQTVAESTRHCVMGIYHFISGIMRRPVSFSEIFPLC